MTKKAIMKHVMMVLLTIGSCSLTLASEKQADMGTVIGIDLGTTYSW
jgi:molecular chaperone DnaK (HSP70)